MSEIVRHDPPKPVRPPDLTRHVAMGVFQGLYGLVGGAVGIVCTVVGFGFSTGVVQTVFFSLTAVALFSCVLAALFRERKARKEDWSVLEAVIDEKSELLAEQTRPIIHIDIGNAIFDLLDVQYVDRNSKQEGIFQEPVFKTAPGIRGTVHLAIRNLGAETSIRNWRGILISGTELLPSAASVSSDEHYSVPNRRIDRVGHNESILVALNFNGFQSRNPNLRGLPTSWFVRFQDVHNTVYKCWNPNAPEPPLADIDPNMDVPVNKKGEAIPLTLWGSNGASLGESSGGATS